MKTLVLMILLSSPGGISTQIVTRQQCEEVARNVFEYSNCGQSMCGPYSQGSIQQVDIKCVNLEKQKK